MIKKYVETPASHKLARVSLSSFASGMKKEAFVQAILAALPTIASILGTSTATAGAFLGLSSLLHNWKYMMSKFKGELSSDLTPEEKFLYDQFRLRGYSPLYSREQAVKSTAMQLGVLSPPEGLPSLSKEERVKMYDAWRAKVRNFDALVKELEHLHRAQEQAQQAAATAAAREEPQPTYTPSDAFFRQYNESLRQIYGG